MATQTTDGAQATMADVGVLNGPEDELLDWHAVGWRAAEEDVRRLRQRIFTASRVGDLKRVRSLQKLMLRSRANTLLSVRRVTELNAGRATAGVDGKVVLLAKSKALLVDRVQRHTGPWQARPVKRVYIPKKGSAGKRRPLGIPVILDRVLQARVVNAMEPEWEARFEPRSYGFRPGRGCHDAIEAIFNVARGANPRRRWVLDADLAGVFDRIDHDHLLGMFGTSQRTQAVLLGGSLNPQNATAFLDLPGTDGLFIGRAARTADGFAEILCRVVGRIPTTKEYV